MGSAASTIRKHENSISDKCVKFCQCFAGLSAKSRSARANRVQAWMALDNNGNGYVSLAETGKWIQNSLINFLGEEKTAKEIYHAFYPSYIRSFKDAADCGLKRKITGKADTDDYVQRGEFRVLCAYLCLYAVMFDAFSLIDGYNPSLSEKDNEGVDEEDDRKVSPKEWEAAYGEFKSSPFVALKMCAASKDLAEAAFSEMDLDGKGAVLLSEFCEWVKSVEIKMGTDFGDILALDADQAKQASTTGIQKKMADMGKYSYYS